MVLSTLGTMQQVENHLEKLPRLGCPSSTSRLLSMLKSLKFLVMDTKNWATVERGYVTEVGC